MMRLRVGLRLLMPVLIAGSMVGSAPVASKAAGGPVVISSLHNDVSPPLRSLKAANTPPGPPWVKPHRAVPRTAHQPEAGSPSSPATAGTAPTLLTSWDGVGNGFTGPSGTFFVSAAPPDTNGAVGPNNYVQTVNTDFAIWNKTGTVLYGPVPINTLWSGFGGGCETNNDGDPVTVYDSISDRFVIAQFVVRTTPYLMCVAVSTTGDPTGTYNRYSFDYGSTNFPDYPKLSVWPDAYYLTTNIFAGGVAFTGAGIAALDRTKMLAGQPATQQLFQTSSQYGGLLPSNLDSATMPPSGSPNYILGLGATASNSLAYWKFHVDFANPALTTLTGPTEFTVPSYGIACGGGACIPQAGTSNLLDSLGDRIMFREPYRNFGDHESLLVSHSVTAGSSVGVRWYELRISGGNPTLFQSGTYAPDSSYRWMGSAAMDKAGGIALGYSESSSTEHPGIRYTGRLAGDPAGQMTQGEGIILTGAGSQTGSLHRWGDYSAMTVDPIDGCTFWYTNEYIPSDGTFNWKTQIASFQLPGCTGAADFSISASPSSVTAPQGGSTSTTISTTTTSGSPQSVTLSASGVPTGTTASFSPNPITSGSSSTLTFNVGASTATGTYTVTVTGTGTSATHTTTVSLTVTPSGPSDFSISANPTSVSAQQGSSTSTMISTTTTSGSPQSVTLSASGVPTGTTASFSPNPITSGSSSTLTFTVGASTATGTYTVTVTGTGTSATHTTTVTLTVTAPPPNDFSISASPSSVSATQGGSTSTTISTTTTSGSPQSVTLSASGVPTGTTASFSPNPITSGGSSTLTFSVGASTATGTYTVTVTGTGTSATHTTTVTLTVTARAAVSYVQGATGSGGGVASVSVSFPSGTGAGHSIFATATSNDTASNVTDSQGNSYTPVDAWQINPARNAYVRLFFANNITGGADTVTVSGISGDYLGLSIVEVAGGPFTLDGAIHGGNNGTGTAVTGPSFTPMAGDFLLAGQAQDQAAGMSPISGWLDGSSATDHTLTRPAGDQAVSMEYRINAAGSATNAGWTDSFSVSWALAYAAFKPPSVTPSDFSISASPTSVSASQGGSTTSTISTATTSGSPQSVSLSASGVPSGTTAGFSPNPVTSGGSSTLTFNVGFGTATGSYTVTVTGTGASATHTTTVTLTVTASDFSISANPTSVSTSQGGSATSTISTATTSGTAQSVSLSTSGLPSGTTASFSPNPITSGSSSTLTFHVGFGTAPGSYTVTVTGTGATATHTTPVTLTVTASDFTISASPTTVSTSQGGSTSSTISTTTTGTAQSVSLSASGVPSGTTAGFSPNPITSGGSSTLSFTVGFGTAPGTYTVTVTGTGTTATHTATVTLTVTASDFSISANPSSVSAAQGGSATSTISTTTTTGTAQSVTLSASGLPSGTTAGFSPNPITSGASSTMTFTVGASTPPGTYTVTVTGTGASATHTTTISLTVTSRPSVAFVQGATGSGGEVASISVAFPRATVAGHSIIVTATSNDINALVTDSLGSTYVPVDAWQVNPANNAYVRLFIANSIAGGADTVKLTGSAGDYLGLSIGEFAGGPFAVDGTIHGSSNGTGTAVTGPSFTPSAGDLIVAGQAQDQAASMSPRSPWLDGSSASDHSLTFATGDQSVSMEYEINAPATAVNAGWNDSYSVSWAEAYVALKPGGSSPSTAPAPRAGSF